MASMLPANAATLLYTTLFLFLSMILVVQVKTRKIQSSPLTALSAGSKVYATGNPGKKSGDFMTMMYSAAFFFSSIAMD